MTAPSARVIEHRLAERAPAVADGHGHRPVGGDPHGHQAAAETRPSPNVEVSCHCRSSPAAPPTSGTSALVTSYAPRAIARWSGVSPSQSSISTEWSRSSPARSRAHLDGIAGRARDVVVVALGVADAEGSLAAAQHERDAPVGTWAAVVKAPTVVQPTTGAGAAAATAAACERVEVVGGVGEDHHEVALGGGGRQPSAISADSAAGGRAVRCRACVRTRRRGCVR